jgi:uncharacterized protein YcfJ
MAVRIQVMKRTHLAATLFAAALALGACTNPDGTRDNRMTGAAAGAVAVGLTGSALRGDSRGALIGATGGALAGAAIGGMQDAQQEQMRQQRQPVRTAPHTW